MTRLSNLIVTLWHSYCLISYWSLQQSLSHPLLVHLFQTYTQAYSICCVSPQGGSGISTPFLLNQHNLSHSSTAGSIKTHLTCISGTMATDTPSTHSMCPANMFTFSSEDIDDVMCDKVSFSMPPEVKHVYESWLVERYFEDETL